MVQDKTIITVSGILGIVILEGFAFMNGINGIMLTATISSLATIIGYSYGINKNKTTK